MGSAGAETCASPHEQGVIARICAVDACGRYGCSARCAGPRDDSRIPPRVREVGKADGHCRSLQPIGSLGRGRMEQVRARDGRRQYGNRRAARRSRYLMMHEFWPDPALRDEALALLSPNPNDVIIDATIGGGGHAFELLKKAGPKGRLLGIDLDQHALEAVRKRARELKVSKQVTLAEGHFQDIAKLARERGFEQANIIFFDL